MKRSMMWIAKNLHYILVGSIILLIIYLGLR